MLEYLSNLESSPHDAIAFLVIGDVLYGNTPDDVSQSEISSFTSSVKMSEFMFQFDVRLNVHKQLEYLQTVSESYWLDLIKEYMVDVRKLQFFFTLNVNLQHEIFLVEIRRHQRIS